MSASHSREELIQAFLANPDQSNQSAVLDQIISERMGTNPRLQLLQKLMNNTSRADSVIENNNSTSRENLSRRTHRRERLINQIQNMTEENAVLRELATNLARALGACESCWGGDPSCTICRGEGTSGWIRPHTGLFKEFIEPVLYRNNESFSFKSTGPVATPLSQNRQTIIKGA